MAKQATQKPQQSQSKAVGFVAAAALSLDVGEKAVRAFNASEEQDDEISRLKRENQSRKGETLKALTMAFLKAATADKEIKLSHCQSEVDAESRGLKQRLEVAVGIRTAVPNGDGTYKIEYSEWAKDIFPAPGEDKKTEIGKKRETFRANFSATFKKAMEAAHGVYLKGIQVQEDKQSGVLMISGKAVKERFGTENVLLNEKREYKEANGRKVTLNKIPSYTELGRISAESAGKAPKGTKTGSPAKATPLTENEVASMVKSLQIAIGKFKNFGDELATALEGLQDTIEKALSDNEGTEAA